MVRKMIFSTLAGAAMLAAGPALAQGQGVGLGGGGGIGLGVGGQPPGLGVGGQPPGLGVGGTPPGLGVGLDAAIGAPGSISETGATMRPKARVNGKASAKASARGVERANARSVLRGRTVIAGPLTGLSVGSNVWFDGGVAGTVERIVPGVGGRVSNVLVRTASGRIVPLAPDSLTFNGTAWTATTLRSSANRR